MTTLWISVSLIAALILFGVWMRRSRLRSSAAELTEELMMWDNASSEDYEAEYSKWMRPGIHRYRKPAPKQPRRRIRGYDRKGWQRVRFMGINHLISA